MLYREMDFLHSLISSADAGSVFPSAEGNGRAAQQHNAPHTLIVGELQLDSAIFHHFKRSHEARSKRLRSDPTDAFKHCSRRDAAQKALHAGPYQSFLTYDPECFLDRRQFVRFF